jgi:hypothetical protein
MTDVTTILFGMVTYPLSLVAQEFLGSSRLFG